MKKISLLLITIVSVAFLFNIYPMMANASTSTVGVKKATSAKVAIAKKKATKKKKIVKKTKITKKSKVTKTASSAKSNVSVSSDLKWDASGLKLVSNLAHFDYSAVIRNAYLKKVENYARRNNIKVITAAVINSMRE